MKMKHLILKTLNAILFLALWTGTINAQNQTTAPAGAAPSGAAAVNAQQQPQRQMQSQPTKKDIAIMEAALIYNKDPKSTLYGAHDPEIIKEDSVYYLFTTGGSVSSSTDLINWKRAYTVFDKGPAWLTTDVIPGTRGGGEFWAPEIQLVNGTYYLYYSMSAFAKNTSAIGVATNKTLNPNKPGYKWEDRGMVVQSVPYRDMWNAIDANLVMDRNQGYLVFGSFWGGIKMVKLAPDLLSIAKPEVWYTIARQERSFPLDESDPGDGTIEGAFIYKHIQYFYLFASLDYCCRGINSDYNVVVGRSRSVEGPYVDRDGKLMSRGGGTLVAKGNEIWAGVGHNSAYTMDGKSIIVMHGYDKKNNGASKLIIRELKWDRGDWPSIDL
jgi:arabinan endo-1,5-alpha-L-arabinosidase